MNPTLIYSAQVLLFAIFPIVIAARKPPSRLIFFYMYISLVLIMGGFLGAVYAIPLTDTITISGGNLAYGALMMSTIVLVIMERDLSVVRNIIGIVVGVNIFKYLLFSAISWALNSNMIINPYDTGASVFGVSAKFMIIGGTLIISELLLLIFLFERIKTRIHNHYLLSVLYLVFFIAVLCLDGVLFPLLALPIEPALAGVIVGGVQAKLVLALSYSIPMVFFLLVFWKDIDRYRQVPLRLQELVVASKETLLQELERQQEAYDEAEFERRFQSRLIDAAGESIIVTDLQGRIIFWNAAAEKIYGWKQEEVIGRSVVEVTPSEDSMNAAAEIMSKLQQGKNWSGEFRVKRRNGETFPALVTDSPLMDRSGKLIGIIGISRDITAQKTIENSLRESEERLRLTLSAAAQGIFDLNIQTGEAKVNDQYALLLGYDPAEFEETNAAWVERLHPDDREAVTKNYRDYISGKIPEYRVEFRQRTKSGDWIWIQSHGKIVEWDRDGNPLRMLGIHTDITERVSAEDKTLRTNQILEEMGRIAKVGGWELDLKTMEPYFTYLLKNLGERVSQPHEPLRLSSRARFVTKRGMGGICFVSATRSRI